MGDLDSPRGSTKSSQQGNKVHWLLHGRDAVEKMGGRFVSEEDLKTEREYWYGMCMQEVRSLETAALERIRRVEDATTLRIDEFGARIHSEVRDRLLQQSEAERGERIAAIAEMRRDLGVQRDLQSQVAALRQDLASVRTALADVARPQLPEAAPQAHGFHGDVQGLASQQQVKAAEAAIADLHNQLSADRERNESQAENTKVMLSDFRHDLSALQVSQIQAVQDQALRCSSELNRSIQEVTNTLVASQGSLKAELQQEFQALRRELEEEHTAADAQLGRLRVLEDEGRGLAHRLDEADRLLLAVRQDVLSETTMLRGRLEAVAGERDEHISELVTLRRLIAEEQSQRTAESRVLTARLEGAEQRLSTPPEACAATAPPTSSVSEDVTVVLTRLELVERELPAVARVGAVAARLEQVERQLPALAKVGTLAARLEQVEGSLPALSVAFEAAKGSAALVARLETLEGLCKTSAGGGDVAALRRGLAELRIALDSTRGRLEGLAKDLVEERGERYKALAEVGRLTEDVAKAAAATIEKAEKRFSEGAMAGQGESVVADGRMDLSSLGTPGKGSHSPDAVSTVSAGTHAEPDRPVLRRPNEDVELRGALAVHVRSLTAELRGEIMGEMAVRVASSDARVGALEERLGAELRRASVELGARVSVLESAQLLSRTASLEEEVKKTSAVFMRIADEQVNRKLASTPSEATEQDGRRAPSVPRQADEPSFVAAPASMHNRPSSRTPSERSYTSSRGHPALGSDPRTARTPTTSAAMPPSLQGSVSLSAGLAGSVALSSTAPADLAADGPLPERSEETGLTHGLKESLEGLVSAVHRTLHQSQRTSPPRPKVLDGGRPSLPSSAGQLDVAVAPGGACEGEGASSGGAWGQRSGSGSGQEPPQRASLAGRSLAQRTDLDTSSSSLQGMRGRGSLEGPGIPRSSMCSPSHSSTHPGDVDQASQSWPALGAAAALGGAGGVAAAAAPGPRAQSPASSKGGVASARTAPGAPARGRVQAAAVRPPGGAELGGRQGAAQLPQQAPRPTTALVAAQAAKQQARPRSLLGPGLGAHPVHP